MFGFLKRLFGVKTAETVSEAPYKIEAPVEAAPAKVETQITDAVTVKPVAEAAPVKEAKPSRRRKPAGQKPAAPKQNAPKQGGNRGRKPKAKTQ